ncbi:AraC family transcriptional regulator [Empedobacter brevis]|uniref:AraC family transcriptional regulator n=2 Tax=Empedobacter brevis TaxID=247 RepID=A0AAJ1QCA9_9FLAO|nr:helix-turn-helix domain-containing protein [Empedobacter brevis]MDM1071448.1 AraC family transcriptional regulator [Empedobacter brevis]
MSSKLITYPFLFTVNKVQEINTTTIKERLSRKPNKLTQPHRTDFFMIYLFTEGKGTHLVDFEPIEVKTHHILFISRGQIHAFDPKETYDGKALIFTEDFFCKSEKDRRFLQETPLFDNNFHQSYYKINNNFNRLNDLFSEIFEELKHFPDRNQGDILHNLLSRILLLSEREIEEQIGIKKVPSSTDRLSVKFRKEVNNHFRTSKKTVIYADMLHVSVRRLQLATSSTFNQTPKEIINDRILLEAKRMLSYDELSVKEIANYLGFEESTNFNKFFKLKLGITPREFKNKL